MILNDKTIIPQIQETNPKDHSTSRNMLGLIKNTKRNQINAQHNKTGGGKTYGVAPQLQSH